ncbi:MAG: helix-turn-helix domain-containing protein [Deltaproteobacteria bacterium]|nr:helix-turn-helix domain-containing protein [Deltaproteobacteria bacterium]
MNNSIQQEYYSATEASKFLGLSIASFYRYLKSDGFPAPTFMGPTRTKRWSRKKLEEYAESRTLNKEAAATE